MHSRKNSIDYLLKPVEPIGCSARWKGERWRGEVRPAVLLQGADDLHAMPRCEMAARLTTERVA